MNIIKAGVRNEFIKLMSRKKYQVLIVLTFFLSIGINMLSTLGNVSTNSSLVVLSTITGFILPLMIAMAAADLFTAEQENGSIKAILTRPISRIKIFSSKILAIFIYSITSLLIGYLSSMIYSILLNFEGLANIWEITLSYAVSIVPIFTIILFSAVISQLCKNSSSTVMMSVFSYMAIVVIGIIFSSISPMLFTSYMGWYKLFIGASMPLASIFNILILLLGYILIFFAAGLISFEKKEY
ncbi:MAG: ABC transporter permease subunit [Candidatus Gracilibacteria bacterium]|nr:ABC transporter permease subunit [Candidatus Gracilibacteria bacterium]